MAKAKIDPKTFSKDFPQFALLADKLAVVPDEAEEKTPGGILLPDATADKRRTGKGVVVQCGPGEYHPDSKRHIHLSIEVGQRVSFGQYTGQIVKLDAEREVTVMREGDVLAILGVEF